jgi:hypothetical protein
VSLGLWWSLPGSWSASQATTDGHWPLEELRSGAPTLGFALAAALVVYVAVRLILTRRR